MPYDLTVRDRNKFHREDYHVPASEKKFELSELFVAFEDIEDPRSSINRLHPLVSVLSIAVLAVLCGADGPTSIRG